MIFEEDKPLGELLIFSDDNVIYPDNFIKIYHELTLNQPEANILGGVVISHWPGEVLSGLLEGIDAVVAFAITPAVAGHQTGLMALSNYMDLTWQSNVMCFIKVSGPMKILAPTVATT